MQLIVNQNDDVPVYLQIYRELRNKIISGAFPEGTKLPSKRTLAADCGVSVATIEHAYSVLCDEDYCRTRERSGCYVIYSPENSFPTAEIQTPKMNFSSETSGNSDTLIPFSVYAAGIRRVLSSMGENILRKSPSNGSTWLREAISRYLIRSRNITASPDQIIIGSGAEYLYGICIQMLGRDRVIALEDPSYEKIRAVYTANGAHCHMLKMDNEGICPDELERTNASVLHVTPFNSFPSGITASANRRREYTAWAERRRAVIIEDDYDSEFALTGTAPETLFSMSGGKNVIYVNTFSQTVAPSIRAGYMLLPLEYLPLYNEKAGFYTCTVPLLEQFFLADLLDSGGFERNINRLRHQKKSVNQILKNG